MTGLVQLELDTRIDAIGSLQRYAEDREVQNGSKHFFLAVGMQ